MYVLVYYFFFCINKTYLIFFFFFSSRRRHTRWPRDWSSDVCSSDLAVLASRPDAHAPVSTQHVAGRAQDATYELPGRTARARDHVRLWRAGGDGDAWAGAATQDVGMLVNPFKLRITHRVAPAVDDERDRIVAALLLEGCADLLGYVRLAGAVRTGRNATSQPFFTDGRAAVMLVHDCPRGL